MNRARLFLMALFLCNLTWAQTNKKIGPEFEKAIEMAKVGNQWEAVLAEIRMLSDDGREPNAALYQLLMAEAYRQDEREVWNTLSQRKRAKEEAEIAHEPALTPMGAEGENPASTTRMQPRNGWMTDDDGGEAVERELSFEGSSFAE